MIHSEAEDAACTSQWMFVCVEVYLLTAIKIGINEMMNFCYIFNAFTFAFYDSISYEYGRQDLSSSLPLFVMLPQGRLGLCSPANLVPVGRTGYEMW